MATAVGRPHFIHRQSVSQTLVGRFGCLYAMLMNVDDDRRRRLRNAFIQEFIHTRLDLWKFGGIYTSVGICWLVVVAEWHDNNMIACVNSGGCCTVIITIKLVGRQRETENYFQGTHWSCFNSKRSSLLPGSRKSNTLLIPIHDRTIVILWISPYVIFLYKSQ